MSARMVFCDSEGRIYDHPELLMAGLDGPEAEAVEPGDVIPLPEGSDLMMLPGRRAVGIDPVTGQAVEFTTWEGKEVFAAAAFVAPAHTQTYRVAYRSKPAAPVLPLFAYTAMGFIDGRFLAAGFRVDDDPRQDPWRFEDGVIRERVRNTVAGTTNSLLLQLEKCALVYGCRAAQNFFLGRWEAPLPVSMACNSTCVGCLSLQKDGRFKASHDRLSTPPSAEEVAEVALIHIGRVPEAVVSFGQGCEGEPLLEDKLITESIRLIRKETIEGTINLNTNASLPRVIESLIDEGLDSIRVSLNSYREPQYNAYYRPKGYVFSDVLASMKVAQEKKCFVSINLLVFPGVTDTKEETEAALAVMEEYPAGMIQMRNLNIDPELYIDSLPAGSVRQGFGIKAFMKTVSSAFPAMRYGYFNPPKESFGRISA